MKPNKNAMGILFIVLIFAAVLAFGFWMFRWQYKRADAALENWARANNYRVLEKQDANPPGTGPKAYRGSNKQVIYRVTVLDANGQKKSGTVKIGSETTGTLSDEIAVAWDE